MSKKIALITGGTSGVGLSIIRELSKKNYTINFIGTNQEKGDQIEKEINDSKFFKVDLSNLKEVNLFIENFKLKHSKLDLLANIAGVVNLKENLIDNEFDKTILIGYVSSFVFNKELYLLLNKSEQGRIVNVSGGKSMVLKNIINFNQEKPFITNPYNPFKSSIKAVHLKTVSTQYFSELYKETNITVNAFHPGLVKSNLTRQFKGVFKLLTKIGQVFLASKSKNGNHLCLSKELSKKSGYLIINKKLTPLNFKDDYVNQIVNLTEKWIKSIV